MGGEGAGPNASGGRRSGGGGGPLGGGAGDGGTGGASAGGTGGDGEVPEDYLALSRSGSRLKVQVYRAEGAPDRFDTFYDDVLETTCEPGKLEDGLWYCLPKLAQGLTPLGFADENCEHALYSYADACTGTPEYASRTVGDCRTSFKAHRLEAPSASGQLYALRVDSGVSVCTAVGGSTFPVENTWIETEPLTSEDLVQMKLETLPSNGSLSARVVTGADGSRAVDKLMDVGTNAVCDASFSAESKACHPTFRAFLDGVYYGNDACTSRVEVAYAYSPIACGEVDFIFEPDLSGPPSTGTYYYPGAEVTSNVWTLLGTDCLSRAEASWLENLREVGAEFEGEFGRYEGQYLGDGRLKLPVLVEGDTPLIPAETPYFDEERSSDCEVREFEDGLRCLPRGYNMRAVNASLTQYADAACTEELIYCLTGSCEAEVYYDGGMSDSCTGAPIYSNMRVVTSPVTEDVYMFDSEGDCVGPVEPSGTWHVESVTAEDFGLVERVTL
jgi:hypothetical protein